MKDFCNAFRNALCYITMLVHPWTDATIALTCNAADTSIAAVLHQIDQKDYYYFGMNVNFCKHYRLN